ncbi:MAG: Release factor glutamine methyltransferase [Bacteroidota bacterium]|jgi:release factor glutamine methyltransferase
MMNALQTAFKNLEKELAERFGEGEARAICRILLEDYFQFKKNNEEHNEIFATLFQGDFEKIRQRLLNNEPVQYIVGSAWFYDLKLKVNPTVLIPRPETEELVEWVLQTPPPSMSVAALDIGTGSGCIPIVLKKKRPDWRVGALDVSESALLTASRNAWRHDADVTFKRFDMLQEADDAEILKNFGNLNVIISNPPYIPNAEKTLMQDNVLQYEPHLALFVADENPLIFYERIADFAKKAFILGGGQKWLFFECNEFNATDVTKMLHQKGFKNIELRNDISGRARMVRAEI